MKWHYPKDGDEPNPNEGTYLIFTAEGDIAEAEYRERLGWFQYRWMVPNEALHVLAWCEFKDIERPKFEQGDE